MGFFSIPDIYAEEGEEFVANENTFKSFPIKKGNFNALEADNIRLPLFFIDGGSQELYKKGKSAFYAIKIAYSKFYSKERVEDKVYETIARIDRDSYSRTSFKDELLFIYKKEIKTKPEENLEENINQVRRILEIGCAKHICSKNKNVIIVIDGSLFWREFDKEDVYELIELAHINNNRLVGFSKSSSLTTNKGNNALDIINEIGPRKQAWLYFPLFFGTKGLKSGCFKLHARAPLAFRFDILNHKETITKENQEAIKALMLNSTDGCFLGYPYGLVYVDQIARVSNKEAEYLRMKHFLSKRKENIKAHDILDTLS